MFEMDGMHEIERVAADPTACTSAELSGALVLLDRLKSQVEAAQAMITAVWDANQAWAADGALTGAAWLAHRTEASRHEARNQVRRSRRLADMPATMAALASGGIGAAKARLLADAWRPGMDQAFAEAEEVLVGHAMAFGVDDTAKIVRRWVSITRPDDDPSADVLGRNASHVSASQTLNGMVVINGTLDAEWGAIVQRELDHITRGLRRAQTGTESDSALEVARREPGNWRAEALVEMARRSGAADGRVPARPLVVAIADAEVLDRPRSAPDRLEDVCELDGAGPIPGETARRLACNGEVSEVVVAPDGSILDARPNRRFASEAQRRALLVRDQQCAFPGCFVDGAACEVHHIVPVSVGGTSVLDNEMLGCPGHHHLLHEGG
ncbi:MAG TPA: DUF222 domain-containing protein, partial [Acidimicrobiales bacterium]